MRSDLIGVVGASGAVGREVLSILRERGYAPDRIRAFGSARRRIPFEGDHILIEELSRRRLHECASAVFCSTAEVAHEWAPEAARQGVKIVDNSNAFRMDPAVPLVIPELNGDQLQPDTRLTANPNCSTILLLMAIGPLRRLHGVRHITVSTYQAVSGAGIAAVEELRQQTADTLAGRPARREVFADQCAFNVFAHESAVDALDGSNGEERKMIAESRRILDSPDLAVFPTCCRVPVERAHSQAIVIESGEAPDPALVAKALRAAPGILFLEDESPTPLKASGRDEVLVGRVRIDRDARRIGLWACMDQLRKGAALNAIQILERIGGLQPASRPIVGGVLPPLLRSSA